MAVSIRKVTLWRTEVAHRPGALAELLDPLAAAGADLQIVMGYRIPGQKTRAVIEVAPVGTRQVARRRSRPRASPPTPPPPSWCSATTGRASPTASPRALAETGVNIAFLVAQVVGRRYSAVFGFESEADLDKAARPHPGRRHLASEALASGTDRQGRGL